MEVKGTLARIDLSQLPDHLLARIAAGEHPLAVLASSVPVDAEGRPVLAALPAVAGVGRYPGSDQSELFAQALSNHYKPFRYETYEDENYYVLGKANRRRMTLDMLDFFDQFLKDSNAPPTESARASGR